MLRFDQYIFVSATDYNRHLTEQLAIELANALKTHLPIGLLSDKKFKQHFKQTLVKFDDKVLQVNRGSIVRSSPSVLSVPNAKTDNRKSVDKCSHHNEKKPDKLKLLIRQLRSQPEALQRAPGDYKELKRVVMNLHFFRRQPVPEHEQQAYGEEEAMVLCKHIKIIYVRPG